MRRTREDLIRYRVERAIECVDESTVMASVNEWNAVVNTLYNACFYVVCALLIKYDINAASHESVKDEFTREFIEPGVFNEKMGNLYDELFIKRTEEEHPTVKYSREEIEPLLSQTEVFVKTLIAKLKE